MSREPRVGRRGLTIRQQSDDPRLSRLQMMLA